jgi:hypothetical protein
MIASYRVQNLSPNFRSGTVLAVWTLRGFNSQSRKCLPTTNLSYHPFPQSKVKIISCALEIDTTTYSRPPILFACIYE